MIEYVRSSILVNAPQNVVFGGVIFQPDSLEITKFSKVIFSEESHTCYDDVQAEILMRGKNLNLSPINGFNCLHFMKNGYQIETGLVRSYTLDDCHFFKSDKDCPDDLKAIYAIVNGMPITINQDMMK